MAKQEGMIIVRGAVGNISYRRTGDGFQVGLKSKLNKDNVLSDKAFEQTRLVNREFGAAGKAGKLIRDAIMIQLKSAGDGKLAPRMQKTLMQALKQDSTSDKGDRRPENGELGFLNGFEFNKSTEMQQIFLVQNVSSIDRPSGKVKVDIPGFTPSDVLMAPEGATHFGLVSAGCELDFPKTNMCWLRQSQTFSVPGAIRWQRSHWRPMLQRQAHSRSFSCWAFAFINW